MKKISVVIHTYNNETILRDCLESVKDFDEIVICDMHSTDKTLQIASEYGCKVVFHENIGWADPARNFAISQASNEWVLVLDSDEKITEALKNYLYDDSSSPEDTTGIKLPRLNYAWGAPLEMLYPDYITRFFKKDAAYWPPFVHAMPEVKYGKIINIDKERRDLAIIHHCFYSYSKMVAAANKYTDLEIEKLAEKNKSVNFIYIIWKCFVLFFEKVFLKGGYKNYPQGLILAYHMSFYKFCSYVKYWEYTNRKN